MGETGQDRRLAVAPASEKRAFFGGTYIMGIKAPGGIQKKCLGI